LSAKKNAEDKAEDFRELNIVAGRRSGKNVLASIISAYEAYKLLVIGNGDPHKFYEMPYGSEINIINVSLSEAQSSRLLHDIRTCIHNSPFFRGRIANSTSKEIRFYTDRDLEIENGVRANNGSISIICRHGNPSGFCGCDAILILFDELAYYESNKIKGEEFYYSIVPSLANFKKFGDGRIVEISSPYKESGIFYGICKSAPQEDSILSFQLPTWCVNPNLTYDDLKKIRERDTEVFKMDYGAQFQIES